MPPRAGRQIAQRNRSNSYTYQTQHGVSDRLQHPSYLPVAALVEHQLDERGSRLRPAAEPPHLRRGGGTVLVVEPDAAREALELFGAGHAAHHGVVGLAHALRGVRDPIHELAVVGKQQQSLGIGVQAAHGNQAHAGQIHQIRHLARRVPVAHGRDVADRLVQGDVVAGAGGGGDGLAVHGDALRVRIDARARRSDDLPVHRYPTGGD